MTQELREKIERDALDGLEVEILTEYALQIEKLAEALKLAIKELPISNKKKLHENLIAYQLEETLSEHSDWLKT